MSLWKIAWRGMQQRALATWLTALSMALGVALVVSVLTLHGVVRTSFSRVKGSYHMIVGPKGGRLDLILNTVYYLRKPIGTIPWSYYQKFVAEAPHAHDHAPGEKHDHAHEHEPADAHEFAKFVERAIPICLGDRMEGHEDFRVVATVPEFVEAGYGDEEPFVFDAGANFDEHDSYAAVLGSKVAHDTGLKVGDEFHPTHDVPQQPGEESHEDHKHHAFKVVGVLKPTGTPHDRVALINIEGFFLIPEHQKPDDAATTGKPAAPGGDAHAGHDHAHDHAHDHGTVPASRREVTAVLVKVKSPLYAPRLNDRINKGLIAQSVSPVQEINDLFTNVVGNVQKVLLFVASLVVVVAAIGIMVSMYNSMSERRREIAIMRSLGARRATILGIVLLESVMLSLLGGALGVLLGHLLNLALSPTVQEQTGVWIGFLQFPAVQFTCPEFLGGGVLTLSAELVLIPTLTLLATIVGILPGVAAYRTDVAKALSASP